MKKISIIILAVFLSSCASFTQTITPVPQPKIVSHYLPWVHRKAQLNAIQNFRVNGNLAIRETFGHGINASFSLDQNYRNYQLNFFGPLGTQSVVITGNPYQVNLTTHQKTYHAATPEQLLYDQLGFNLPVSHFYYWLRGLPAPDLRYTSHLDAYNRMMQLRQAGWRIVYQHFTNIGKIDLPDRIELSNCQWQVRIKLNRWDIK